MKVFKISYSIFRSFINRNQTVNHICFYENITQLQTKEYDKLFFLHMIPKTFFIFFIETSEIIIIVRCKKSIYKNNVFLAATDFWKRFSNFYSILYSFLNRNKCFQVWSICVSSYNSAKISNKMVENLIYGLIVELSRVISNFVKID